MSGGRAMSDLADGLATTYNYAIFRGEEDFDAFAGRPHAGERAPDIMLTDLEGNTVALSSLWRANYLVLEFGSYT
jgi:hypothetical protein